MNDKLSKIKQLVKGAEHINEVRFSSPGETNNPEDPDMNISQERLERMGSEILASPLLVTEKDMVKREVIHRALDGCPCATQELLWMFRQMKKGVYITRNSDFCDRVDPGILNSYKSAFPGYDVQDDGPSKDDRFKYEPSESKPKRKKNILDLDDDDDDTPPPRNIKSPLDL